jgi:arabinose-5-phosphate isomerase
MDKYAGWGREVMDAEIEAIRSVRDRIGDQFAEAVRAIKSCKGKLIVTGIGKSGHVGKKMAASFASLGTPSFFMHSTEALHGDSGMMEKRDLLIAISNSGKTGEVVAAAELAAGMGMKVIAMTGSRTSPLAEIADIWIDIAVKQEADHLNLAPTSSSTVTLVTGDALAVAAARAKNFSPSDFASRHPGGALGKKSRL